MLSLPRPQLLGVVPTAMEPQAVGDSAGSVARLGEVISGEEIWSRYIDPSQFGVTYSDDMSTS